MADETYQPKTYRKDGGDIFVVASGGRLVVESGGEMEFESGAIITEASIIRNIRVRATRVEVNAGLTILPAVAGKKYRMVDCKLIAIGGAAQTATGVQIKCDTVLLIDAKVAALTQSTVARAGDENVNVLADGASFVVQAENKAITVIKDGSDLATATHIDVILDYVIEE